MPQFVRPPVSESRSPIFNGILLGVFLTTAVIEAALGFNSCNHVSATQVDLDPLTYAILDLTFWTPAASCCLLAKSVMQTRFEIIRVYMFFDTERNCMIPKEIGFFFSMDSTMVT